MRLRSGTSPNSRTTRSRRSIPGLGCAYASNARSTAAPPKGRRPTAAVRRSACRRQARRPEGRRRPHRQTCPRPTRVSEPVVRTGRHRDVRRRRSRQPRGAPARSPRRTTSRRPTRRRQPADSPTSTPSARTPISRAQGYDRHPHSQTEPTRRSERPSCPNGQDRVTNAAQEPIRRKGEQLNRRRCTADTSQDMYPQITPPIAGFGRAVQRLNAQRSAEMGARQGTRSRVALRGGAHGSLKDAEGGFQRGFGDDRPGPCCLPVLTDLRPVVDRRHDRTADNRFESVPVVVPDAPRSARRFHTSYTAAADPFALPNSGASVFSPEQSLLTITRARVRTCVASIEAGRFGLGCLKTRLRVTLREKPAPFTEVVVRATANGHDLERLCRPCSVRRPNSQPGFGRLLV